MNVSIKLIYLGWESNIERKTFRYLLKGQIDRIALRSTKELFNQIV